MKVDTVLPTGTITQAIRYRDLGRAVDWLCDAFGFEKHLVVPEEAGRVIYAQLTYGNGMVLLGPVEASEFDDLLIQPEQISGAETQCCYVVVREIDAHYARAEAAGAPILIPLQGEDYGGRRYTCRDLEGHIWNFGTTIRGRVRASRVRHRRWSPPSPGVWSRCS